MRKLLTLLLSMCLLLGCLYLPTGAAADGASALSSLTVSDGSALSPSFSSSVTSYTLELMSATLSSLPTLNYTAADADASVTSVAASASNGYRATITVTKGSDSTTYTVQYLLNWAYKENCTSVTGSEGSWGVSITACVDGDTSTGFKSTTSDGRVQVQFPCAISIYRFAAYSGWTSNANNYKFSYSNDGVTWTETPKSTKFDKNSVTGDPEGVAYSPSTPIEAKYVKLENTTGISYLGINEFCVYGVPMESDPSLSSLTPSSGELSPAFDPDVKDYSITLSSKENLPTLSYTTVKDDATVAYTAASESNNYKASLVVTHKGVSATYTVTYNILDASAADLSALRLSVDGETPTLVDGFDKSKTEYQFRLSDASKIPVVSAETVHPEASLVITQGNAKTMTAEIKVTSADGTNTKTYKVLFLTNIALSSSSWCGACYSGNESDMAHDGNFNTLYSASGNPVHGGYVVINFECLAKIYEMRLYQTVTGVTSWFDDLQISTDGSTWQQLNGVTVKKSEEYVGGTKYNKMDFTFKSLPIETRYLRVSGTNSGKTNMKINELEIYGVKEPVVSADSFLKSISVDGEALSGFSSYVSDYTVKLGANDTIPTVAAETKDSFASLDIKQATEANPVATITVTAENGLSKMTYTVTFEKEVPAEKNVYLSQLSFARGTLSPSFTAANGGYTLYLETGSAAPTASEITATAAASGANVSVTTGDPIAVTVTSADGSATKTYTISVVYGSAKLESLTATGYDMKPSFSPSVKEYSIELAAGEGIPQIDVATDGKYIHPVAASGASFRITQASASNPAATITVTDAAGMFKQTYTIRFTYAQSLAEAQEAVQTALKNASVSNKTTASDIMDIVEDSVTNDAISAAWSSDFELKKATSKESGLVSGAVTLSFGADSVVVEIRKSIDKLESSSGGSSSGRGSGGYASSSVGGSVTVDPSTAPDTDNVPQVKDPYAELRGHWAEKEALALIEKGIVTGKGDSYDMDAAVTRAEFITMLIRACGLEVLPYEGAFSDVSAEDWYASFLQTAKANGFLEGSEGNALPSKTTNREEAVKMLVAVYEYLYGELEAGENISFSDSEQISDWAMSNIQKAVLKGLIYGYETGEFGAKDLLNRAQAMTMVYRLINNQ